MKDQWVGDITDFGKLGLLQALAAAGLKIGVNWMLTPPGEAGPCGGTGYLREKEYRETAPALCRALEEIAADGDRRVTRLETPELLSAGFYHEPLDFGLRDPAGRNALRKQWHQKALQALAGSELVFLDPDIGLLVPSAAGSRRENRYVTREELRDYYAAGASLCCSQQQARRVGRYYLAQMDELLRSGDFPGAAALALRYNPPPRRYYFFLLHPEHRETVCGAVQQMLREGWKNYFALPTRV